MHYFATEESLRATSWNLKAFAAKIADVSTTTYPIFWSAPAHVAEGNTASVGFYMPIGSTRFSMGEWNGNWEQAIQYYKTVRNAVSQITRTSRETVVFAIPVVEPTPVSVVEEATPMVPELLIVGRPVRVMLL